MSGQVPKKITKEDGKPFAMTNIEDLTTEVIDDCFFNIIHDIVLEVHREEKILRMQSAAVVAEREARNATALARATDSETQNSEPKSATSPSTPSTPYERTETEGAIVEPDGKVYLKGNPLKTTPIIYCPQCKLPRLLYPTTGYNSRPPPDLEAQYCAHQPFIIKAGHDVHGNPFATDKVSNRGKNKKQQQEEKEKESLASSPSTEPSTPVNSSFKSNANPEKVSFPTIKCPNCPRYLVVTRVAAHLAGCLGISGRQSSRNAMTKMSSTPNESRANTPKPSAKVLKRKADGDGNGSSGTGDGESPPKKKSKPTTTKKKATDTKPAQSSKLKNGETVNGKAAGTEKKTGGKTTGKKGAGKPPSTKGPAAKTTPTDSTGAGEEPTSTQSPVLQADVEAPAT